MKKIGAFIFCLVAMVLSGSGCRLWEELNQPPKKRVKTAKKDNVYKPATLPDGTTSGLNDYEMQYIKDINQEFKQRQQRNARSVFGGLSGGSQ